MFLNLLIVGIFFSSVSSENKRQNAGSKGELEADEEILLPLKETLILLNPPQPIPGRWPVWMGKEVAATVAGNKPGSRTPQDFRSKGDEAALDPRGTVRYNILPDGKIARGVITNKADQNALFAQAQEITEHSATYDPLDLFIDEEEE